jgi:hypothetical protein
MPMTPANTSSSFSIAALAAVGSGGGSGVGAAISTNVSVLSALSRHRPTEYPRRTYSSRRDSPNAYALLYWGVAGNIGGRDGYLEYGGFRFGLIEGQFTKGDFGSWRSFVYDYQTGNAEPLAIHTHGGSRAFANPKLTNVSIDGQPALVVTLFLPSEGVAPGEAGELIYFRKYR